MDKNTSTLSNRQEKLLFSLPAPVSNKKIKVDFSSPDISSHGVLAFLGSMKGSFAKKTASCIPDYRNEFFIPHTYRKMICQRIGRILCDYDLSSQSTMTRLENKVSKRTLYNRGLLFLKEFACSYDKAPKRASLKSQ